MAAYRQVYGCSHLQPDYLDYILEAAPTVTICDGALESVLRHRNHCRIIIIIIIITKDRDQLRSHTLISSMGLPFTVCYLLGTAAVR